MKTKIITIALFVFNSFLAFSQLCVPDTNYAHKEGNIYPEAYHARLNPNAGTLDSACINEDYSFVFTAVVPDSLPTEVGVFKLDSLVVLDNGVLDIPTGIKYKCNPPNCKFVQGTLGCLELYGKPDISNEIKVYDLKLKVKISVEDGFIVVNDTLPAYLSDSAHYFLPLFPQGSPNCWKTAVIDESYGFKVKVAPNPISDRIVFTVELPQEGMLHYSLKNIQGQEIFKADKRGEKYQVISINDLSLFRKGIYFLETRYENRVVIKKVIIH